MGIPSRLYGMLGCSGLLVLTVELVLVSLLPAGNLDPAI